MDILMSILHEQQKKSEAAADQCDTGLKDVACDLCTRRKRKASKSCTQCLVSYCEDHLQPHHDVPAMKKHKLIEPVENLEDNICFQHKQVKTRFCLNCKECICDLCQTDKHTDHRIEPVELAQEQLQAAQLSVQHRVQVLESDISLLQQELPAINESADKVVSEIENKLQAFLIQKIKQQQQTEITRVQNLLKQLQQMLAEEKKQDTELEQIAQIKSYTDFFKQWSSVSAKEDNTSITSAIPEHPSPLKYFEQAFMAVSEFVKGFENLTQTVIEENVSLTQNSEFLQYSTEITLNRNTASNTLALSEYSTKVAYSIEKQSRSPHPDRFIDKPQVLSIKALPPRCYWEVEWTGISVLVGVAYKAIMREGPESEFGNNNKSWMLECQKKRGYSFKHNSKKEDLRVPCQSHRIRVFLDYKAGILSFYEVSETNKFTNSSTNHLQSYDYIYKEALRWTWTLFEKCNCKDVCQRRQIEAKTPNLPEY
ncbi:hypothetical protein WMY93_020482 [Mugilogobius chulae]|uniref:Uncharacterized protein n=1 Tax=Mugilogobius chulae TaxID=88201 RepID=A0AAW0NUI5_9GOBI